MIDRRTVALGGPAWLAAAASAADLRAAPARIGLVEAGTAAANQHFVSAFLSGLSELGYVLGRTATVDVRWAEGKAERFPELSVSLSHEIAPIWREYERGTTAIVDAYLKKKVEEQAKVSDADLQKFYDQNKEKFRTGAEVRASHILVKDEKKAQEILAQLKGGASFEELAKKNSTDGAAAKGGDLGWFGKGSMIPDFEKVAFGLKEGETSGIVKTKYGFHIIKLTGKREAGIRPFSEVKDQIKAAIEPEKQQEVFKKLKEDLKKSAKYTIKEDVLKGLGGSAGEEKKPAAAAPAPAPAPAPGASK